MADQPEDQKEEDSVIEISIEMPVIEISAETEAALDRIVAAGEDAEALARVAIEEGITPQEFREFLAETGEEQDPDAQELLAWMTKIYAEQNLQGTDNQPAAPPPPAP